MRRKVRSTFFLSELHKWCATTNHGTWLVPRPLDPVMKEQESNMELQLHNSKQTINLGCDDESSKCPQRKGQVAVVRLVQFVL